MAERPKISIKPSAPSRDPHRPRVRGVTSPRPPAVAGDARPEPRGARDARDPRDLRDPRASGDNRETRDPGDTRITRNTRDPRDPQLQPQPRPQPRATPRPAPRGEAQGAGQRPDRRPPQASEKPQPTAQRPAQRPPYPADRRSATPAATPQQPASLPSSPQAAPRPAAAAPRVVAAAPSAAGQRPASAATAAQGVRISKLMTERGLASRREADDWIAAGWVSVGGKLAELGQRVPIDAVLDINPRARDEQARQVTVLLHKPMGIVSAQAEDGYEPAITLVTPANRWSGDTSGIHYQPGHLRHLAPAGRLDIDSTGLLVFTQDGRVAKRLIGDQTRVEKEYLVRVAYPAGGQLPEADMARLRHGLTLDGVLLRPAAVSWQNEEQLRFVLREGRKRQIRRMCELVGLQVLGLKRVRIGSVPLGQLPVGQWRYLRDDERF